MVVNGRRSLCGGQHSEGVGRLLCGSQPGCRGLEERRGRAQADSRLTRLISSTMSRAGAPSAISRARVAAWRPCSTSGWWTVVSVGVVSVAIR